LSAFISKSLVVSAKVILDTSIALLIYCIVELWSLEVLISYSWTPVICLDIIEFEESKEIVAESSSSN
jgi:hypothetical protein